MRNPDELFTNRGWRIGVLMIRKINPIEYGHETAAHSFIKGLVVKLHLGEI